MSKDVSRTDSSGSTTVDIPQQYPRIAAMMERLSIECSIQPEEDFRYDIAEIVENMLAGESPEEVFARQDAGSLASKDFLNHPFLLHKDGITWKRSTMGSVFPFYALLRVTDISTGETRVINTGGATCIAVLDALVVRGYLDEEKGLMFVEKPTAAGFSVVMIRPVPVPAGKRS